MSKFWGCVKVGCDGVHLDKGGDFAPEWEKTEPSDLPEWVKTKMAMLDLMEPLTRLPCESYRYLLAHPKNGVSYTIMEDEDDRNN